MGSGTTSFYGYPPSPLRNNKPSRIFYIFDMLLNDDGDIRSCPTESSNHVPYSSPVYNLSTAPEAPCDIFEFVWHNRMKMPSYGILSMLKEDHRHLSGQYEVVLQNIEAGRDLSAITRTSLGPNGMNKMVINHLDKIVVTNDAVTDPPYHGDSSVPGSPSGGDTRCGAPIVQYMTENNCNKNIGGEAEFT
ncbi:hypothetical protein PR202_ga12669 [Eleusine coracana subsp. coracana]|uniref:Uncharacterized protein n=1 Tax=Eleusine coracana subsp. coracana TaxID=191504 RepID=A0AAV5CCQ5_ELECO|nr:hypothetical protein PR202_ga12669 [Eleusine coracana subsp. coracana]